jgi:DNA-binding NarL/FixJ family response regulator
MIRVLIAEDSLLVRDSIRRVLDAEHGLLVVGCASNTEELEVLLPFSNAVLLSTTLAGIGAERVLATVRDLRPEAKVFVMGAADHPQAIMRYIEAGAAGYILENDSVEDMVGKLRAVEEGEAYISPVVAACLMNRVAQLAQMDGTAVSELKLDLLGYLTPREEEILELISHGYSNQEIAAHLVIECGTVKNHVHNILSKLDTSSRRDAASLFRLHRQNGSRAHAAVA